MRMDHNAEKPGVSTKHTPGIAVLLMRLLECGKIWDTMQVFVSNVEEIRLPKNNLNEAISRLISECKILFQVSLAISTVVFKLYRNLLRQEEALLIAIEI